MSEVMLQKSDIDKELELLEKRLELSRLERENLQIQLSLRKDTTIRPEVGQTGYY